MANDLTFWEHLSELRTVLIKCLMIILLGTVCALYFYQEIFAFLTHPLQHNLNISSSELQHQEIHKERIFNPNSSEIKYQLKGETEISSFSYGVQQVSDNVFLIPSKGFIEFNHLKQKGSDLVLFSPLEGFIASFRVSFWVGLVGTSPFWVLFIIQFLLPALHVHERKLVFSFLILSFIFMAIGILSAFFFTIPIANHYLQMFNQGIGINLWGLDNYLSYTVTLLLSNAFAFEMGVVLFLLVHCGIISAEAMKSKRRHMIVVAFIIGAILTPPDVLTQFMLAIPLIILYEAAILYASYLTRTWTRSFLPWSSRY